MLANVLYDFGEERHSRRIARAIKQMDSYDSTLALAEVIKVAHPKWQKGKLATYISNTAEYICIYFYSQIGGRGLPGEFL